MAAMNIVNLSPTHVLRLTLLCVLPDT